MPGDQRSESVRAAVPTGAVEALLTGALRSLGGSGAGDLAPGDLALDDFAAGDRAALRVLDCGGGSGRFAVPLAQAGAAVTVVDISVDALATLRRRAAEAGVADRVVAVQADVEALGEIEALTDIAAGPASAGDAVAGAFDLVLAHGILEVVDSLSATFAAMASAVRPGGLISVLVGNPVHVILSRVLAGDLPGAERELSRVDGSPAGAAEAERATPAVVQRLCIEHGLSVEQVHGVGVFRDLVPGQALEAPGARDALARLEAACAQLSPFGEIAARVHVLARRAATAPPAAATP